MTPSASSAKHPEFTRAHLRPLLAAGLDEQAAGSAGWLVVEPALWAWLPVVVLAGIPRTGPGQDAITWDAAAGVVTGFDGVGVLRESTFPAAVQQVCFEREFLLSLAAALLPLAGGDVAGAVRWLLALFDDRGARPSAAYLWWYERFRAEPGFIIEVYADVVPDLVRGYLQAAGGDQAVALAAFRARIGADELEQIRAVGSVSAEGLRLLGGLAGD